jgi:hypothetical protein
MMMAFLRLRFELMSPWKSSIESYGNAARLP